MGVKIAVVGGGSTYTPELIEGFEARRDRMPIDQLVLLDVDRTRLEIVGGLAQRMLDRLDWTGRLVCTLDRDEALEGADFVLIQLRIGGQAARLVDETLPPQFGVIGQETTGAGGFAKALRTVPVVLDIAEETARRAAPGAWIVDFTNPVGIVSQALIDAGHRALGLCNVAINIQRGLAERFGVDPDRVEIEHVGLNHLSWERAVRVDGVDRLPELLDGGAAGARRFGGRLARGRAPASGDPVLLPALLRRDADGRRRTARRPHARPGGHGHRGPAPRDVQGPGPGREAGACSRRAAAPTTARRPRGSSRRSTTGRAMCRSWTCATTGHSPTWPTRTSSRSRP